MIDAIVAWPNLCDAWVRVAENAGAAGADAVSITRFARNWEEHLRTLAALVAAGRYEPGGLRRVVIPKRDGGQRLLRIPNVGDRVLQRAALTVLEPIMERRFLPCSYGYRPRRGVRDAVAAIVRLRMLGRTWVLDADIDDCFDSIDHRLLIDFLKEEKFDAGTIALLKLWLHAGRTAAAPARGLAQGMPISPLLCNLYLHELDWALVKRRWHLVRYADDFVICCASRGQADHAQEVTAAALADLKLCLEPRKTRVTSFNQGFDFLGVRFQGDEYIFTWEDKRIAVSGAAPEWIWSYAPQGYE